jgi:hypothetical protein
MLPTELDGLGLKGRCGVFVLRAHRRCLCTRFAHRADSLSGVPCVCFRVRVVNDGHQEPSALVDQAVDASRKYAGIFRCVRDVLDRRLTRKGHFEKILGDDSGAQDM